MALKLVKHTILKRPEASLDNYFLVFSKDEVSTKWFLNLIFYYNSVHRTQLFPKKHNFFYIKVFFYNWVDLKSFILYFVNKEEQDHDRAFFDEPYTFGFVTNSIVQDRFLNKKIKILGIFFNGYFVPKVYFEKLFSINRAQELKKINMYCFKILYMLNIIFFFKKNFYINSMAIFFLVKVLNLIRIKHISIRN